MGMIRDFFAMFFGSDRNVIVETAEVFRVNAEAESGRDAAHRAAALQQYAAEFGGQRVGWFDRFINGLNRLPRPMMAFGVLGLMIAAMVDPVWFSQRMVGIGLVPEPMWWLMGAIVSFYFGARHQAHGQAFQTSIAQTMARVPQVVSDIQSLEELEAEPAPQANPNAALREWQHTQP